MENNSKIVDTTAENMTVGQVPSASVARVPTSVIPVSVLVNHGEKLEKFNALNFKRWQQKMLLYLTTLNLVRFLTEEAPESKKHEANASNDINQDVSDIKLSEVVSEVKLVGSNPKEWWIDTGATRHVCSDKALFTFFEPIENGEKLFMGNSATSEIEGQGRVVLKMTSGKELTLNNVLYVLEIRKNLVSGSLLNKHGFRMVFESDKVVLSKNGMYVGKGYVTDGLFKLNVMTVKPKNINKVNNSSAYLLESSSLWHNRLGHVNYDIMHRLINLDHIPAFQIDSKHKCETCVEAKMTRSSFQGIERNTEPLDLVHSDVCDLKFVQTRVAISILLLLLMIA